MVVKRNDKECNEVTSDIFSLQRTKIVTLEISPTITLSQHNLTAYITLAIFSVMLLVAVIGGVVYFGEVMFTSYLSF